MTGNGLEIQNIKLPFIRRTMTIILLPMVAVAGAVSGMAEFTKDWVKDHWDI